MILVDTSVWVDHLRRGSPRLSALLANRDALQHPFVTGELALGGLPLRERMLTHLADLPRAPVVDHTMALRLLEAEHLYGRGLGWVDVHLLATSLHSRCLLWTNDRSLARAAQRLGIAA